MALALPALLALCFLTGPLQVPDEPAHFFRADQISLGAVAPVLAPGGHAAGGLVDSAAQSFVQRLGSAQIDFDPSHRFHLSDVWPGQPAGGGQRLVFQSFSNTVIYFPLAHLIPALAILAGKLCSAQAVVWFYAARLGNAAAAIMISALAISLFEETAVFAFVFCLLPMVLFEEASVSADALVIPGSILFASMIGRISRGGIIPGTFYCGMFLVTLCVCVTKFAYMPLAVTPVFAAIFQRRGKPEVFKFAIIALLAVMVFLLWSSVIRSKVFTIASSAGFADVGSQIGFLAAHPMVFPAVFWATLCHDSFAVLSSMVGAQLGWLDIDMPRFVIFLSLEAVAFAVFLRPPIPGIGWLTRVTVCVLLFGALAAAYFLLYLQITPVGNFIVNGVQGRYWLPLLALAPLVVPSLSPGPIWSRILTLVLVAASGLNVIATVLFVWSRYWCWRLRSGHGRWHRHDADAQ